MENSIEYAQVFQEELDNQMIAKATSGWMELNADLVKYNGGDEIKIATLAMDGLGDYSRTNGFPGGSINLSFNTYAFAMDRARTFSIDRMDVDESNFVLSAANVMSTFQQDYVIPEVDAYRYSTIAKIAVDNGKASSGYVPDEATIFETLLGDIATIQDLIGEDKELVITMSIKTAKILNASAEIAKHLDVTDFKKGEVSTKVQSLDGIPIIKVPSARFYSAYDFKSGGTGEEAGGFAQTTDASDINWIIAARQSVIAVSKTEEIRIFEPKQNPNADAWKLDYRKYHDVWVTKNKLNGIFANIQ
ncbi:MAG: hypothetical protein LBU77_04390 [Clostridiales bacterium]|jgi:hypothetical protein|nr:hypothetical protein [Clostridiales bacterium]